jgi:hypothetical protein
MAKVAFSRSDVVAINGRMASKSAVPKEANFGTASTTLSRSPSSPVAAKVMREVGVSKKKMSEAYSFARTAAIKSK